MTAQSSPSGDSTQHQLVPNRRGTRLAWTGPALVLALQWVFAADALAINKCRIDGRVSYQDAPCRESLETVAQGLERKRHFDVFHRQLDLLQAQGQGKVAQRNPAPHRAEAAPMSQAKYTPVPDGTHFLLSLHTSRVAGAAPKPSFVMANLLQTTSLQKGAPSAAVSLAPAAESAGPAACGGRASEYPRVGMSEEVFRNCTTHARFGGVTQIVASEDGKVPLRLYVFATEKASKVYAVGGVITAVKP